MKGDIALAGFMMTAQEWEALDAPSRALLMAIAMGPSMEGASAGSRPGPNLEGANAGSRPGPKMEGASAGSRPGPKMEGASAGSRPGPDERVGDPTEPHVVAPALAIGSAPVTDDRAR